MARFKKLTVLNKLHSISMVPLFYHQDFEVVKNTVKACVEAGAEIVEFTNRGPGALDVFKAVEAWCAKELPQAILGVGSIVDPATAAMFVDAGANFIVSPNMDEDTAIFCNKRKIPYMPGCGTVTEIHNAEKLGVDVCKLFPGDSVGGPAFVKGVLAPRPWSCLMPTGGVAPTEDSLKAWFDAGIVCCGMGSKLITKDIIKEGKYDELKLETEKALNLIKSLKGS